MTHREIEERLAAASADCGVPVPELRRILLRTALDAYEGPGVVIRGAKPRESRKAKRAG